jgi:RNA polymerase sigma-70 factor (ECF subfamily)
VDTVASELPAAPAARRRGEVEAGPERGVREACQAGDFAALEQWLGSYERSLYLLCRGMLGHAEDAEDAVQETFLRALRALPRFRGDASGWTWLYRIAVNVCLEWKRRRRTLPAETLAEPAAPVSLEGEAVAHLAALAALAALPPRQRAIVILKRVEERSVPEIAAATGLSERRVYHELRLAQRTLAEWQRRNEEEGGRE